MHIIAQKVDGLVHEVEVSLSGEIFQEHLKTKLITLGSKKTVQGFRKGKTPLHVLKQRFEKDATPDVIEHIIKKYTDQIITDKKLVLASPPACTVTSIKDDQSLMFTVKVEVRPEIILPDISTFHIKRLITQIDKDKLWQEYLSKYIEIDTSGSEITDRPAQENDLLCFSYKEINAKDEEALERNVILREKHQQTEFDKMLGGLKKGETKQIALPKENNKEESTTYTLTLKNIHQPLTEEEALLKLTQFKSAEKIKENVALDTQHRIQHRSALYEKRQVLDYLDAQSSTFLLPPAMLKKEFQNIWNNLLITAKNENITFTKEQDKENRVLYQKLAIRRVRLALIIQQIGKDNSIIIQEKELLEYIARDATRRFPETEKKFFKYVLNNKDALQDYYNECLENKVIGYVLSKGKIIEQVVDMDNFYTEVEKVLV